MASNAHHQENRLIIVSNRLPITIVQEKNGFSIEESVGGLATGLHTYIQSAGISEENYPLWIGWPGTSVDEHLNEPIKRALAVQFHAQPVFLTNEDVDDFYYGFCNRILWPLFHYFPDYVEYNEVYWTSYKKVNQLYCQAILEVIKPGDTLWIHDYHLMLLPQLIRKSLIDCHIGFYLHIPFPSFEFMRLLPSEWSTQILESLLSCNLLGFHTTEYTQHFLTSVQRILGYQNSMGLINTREHLCKANTIPMGVDFQSFWNAINEPEVQKKGSELRQLVEDRKVVLSLDRLDYTKGIPNRMYGYELFLEQYPAWREKVVMLVVLTPSRMNIEQYQRTKEQIDDLVERVNEKFATSTWQPIIYQYKLWPFSTISALYILSDVCLVTSYRDGMPLISKEYLAARSDRTGVLILSETVGAARELSEALIVNPNSPEEIANALYKAVEMPLEEQRARNQAMQIRLERNNIVAWADTFLQQLYAAREVQDSLTPALLQPATLLRLQNDYRQARRRLLVLDESLMFASDVPLEVDLFRASLLHLAAIVANEVILVSDRSQAQLQERLAEFSVGLIAEGGAWIRTRKGAWRSASYQGSKWQQQILPLFRLFEERIPESFIEIRNSALLWHYPQTDSGILRARELLDYLVGLLAHTDVRVVTRKNAIEVRLQSVRKDSALSSLTAQEDFDFVMLLGADEELFSMASTSYAIKVGPGLSHAKLFVPDIHTAASLLEQLTIQTDNK